MFPIPVSVITGFLGAGKTSLLNRLLKDPALTDAVWRWGGSEATIRETIGHGRLGVMPAHGETLGADKVRLLAAYVYGLEKD